MMGEMHNKELSERRQTNATVCFVYLSAACWVLNKRHLRDHKASVDEGNSEGRSDARSSRLRQGGRPVVLESVFSLTLCEPAHSPLRSAYL